MAQLKSFLHFESMEGGGGEARAAPWFEGKGVFPAVASAGAMQVPCRLFFVSENGGGKPLSQTPEAQTPLETSSVSQEEEKMAATLPRFLLPCLPAVGKGWK